MAVPIYLAGELVEAGSPLQVRNSATGEREVGGVIVNDVVAGGERRPT